MLLLPGEELKSVKRYMKNTFSAALDGNRSKLLTNLALSKCDIVRFFCES